MGRPPKTSKQIGNEFHDSVSDLLARCGFHILENNYSKAGPDIVMRIGETKVIVQCKKAAKSNQSFIGLESLVDEYSNKCKKYNAACAIIAVSGYQIPGSQRKKFSGYLKEDKVAVWDDQIIEYYEELCSAIHKYSAYQILGDLEQHASLGDAIRIPSFEIEQSGQKFYVAAMKARQLLDLAYVLRRVYKKEAYQRFLSRRRVKTEIPEYLERPGSVFPTALVCVAKKGLKYSKGILELPAETASVWIIDGQHRLFGFANVTKDSTLDFPLLCTVFDGSKMTALKQGQLFVDINSNAKTVQNSLILELYPSLGIRDVKVDVGRRLRELDSLKGAIKTYDDRLGTINFVTLCLNQAMKNICDEKGVIAQRLAKRKRNSETALEDACFEVCSKFIKLVNTTLRKEWNSSSKYILKTDKGIRPLFRLLEQILRDSNGRFDSERAKGYLRCLRGKNALISSNELYGLYAGEGGAKKLFELWVEEIRNSYPDFAPGVIVGKSKEVERDSISLNRGDSHLAEEFIKKWFSAFSGNVYGVLQIIDKTTVGYLRTLLKSSRIRLLVSKVGDRDRVLQDLKQMRQDGWNIHVIQVKRLDEFGGGAVFHERWIGTDSYRLNLETDLKQDHLARHKHTKTLYVAEGGDSHRAIEFMSAWNFYEEHPEVEITQLI